MCVHIREIVYMSLNPTFAFDMANYGSTENSVDKFLWHEVLWLSVTVAVLGTASALTYSPYYRVSNENSVM